MFSFERQLEGLMHPANAAQTVNCGTLPTFPDAPVVAWPPTNQASYPHTQQTTLAAHDEMEVSRVKRGSRALVFICPETNAPIDHYRSDQSSTSARSTTSSDDNVIPKMVHSQKACRETQRLPSDPVGNGVSQLPMRSKLHRWMGSGSKAEVVDGSMGGCLDAPTGLYYNGSKSIWNPSKIVEPLDVLPLNAGEMTLSGRLSEEMQVKKEESSPGQGVPKSSRLWTWIGDRELTPGMNDI